jgi:hypothetical protein|tara:strand:- start:487 stop:999 length:513 start_codon:yes stop_codon:yes gene_type:complete
MKKGQMIGQVFIYILAIILTAVILGYGYKTIVTFRENSEKISYIQFQTDLQNSVETITSDFGSVKIIGLSLPANFKKVCFVKNYQDFSDTFSAPDYPIIENSVVDGAEKNVFLVENIAKESFYVGKIDLDDDSGYLINDDLLCISVLSGKLRLRLEGKGDHTKIREIGLS